MRAQRLPEEEGNKRRARTKCLSRPNHVLLFLVSLTPAPLREPRRPRRRWTEGCGGGQHITAGTHSRRSSIAAGRRSVQKHTQPQPHTACVYWGGVAVYQGQYECSGPVKGWWLYPQRERERERDDLWRERAWGGVIKATSISHPDNLPHPGDREKKEKQKQNKTNDAC